MPTVKISYQIEYLLLCKLVLLLEEVLQRHLEPLHERVRGLQHCWHSADVALVTPSIMENMVRYFVLVQIIRLSAIYCSDTKAHLFAIICLI